jgi:putative FmdB family regulatory protein
MPNYLYRCEDCQKRFEVFLTYADFDTAEVKCPKCGSTHVTRRIPRVRVARSADSRLENFADDPSKLEGLEDDPKALGRLMRQMGDEMGEEIGPEFDEVVSRLEKGQSPEEIEQELPDLGDAFDDGDDY